MAFSLRNSLPAFIMVNRDDRVIQVGSANVSTMRNYSKCVGPDGCVMIIEPEPENVSKLRLAMENLKYRNVIIVPKGAWYKKATVQLSLSPNKGDHKIEVPGIRMDNDFRPENTYEKKVEIEVDTIDEILREYGLKNIHFMNVTVNGAELEVLKGSQEVLKNKCLRLWVKGHALLESGDPLNKLVAPFLDEHGFSTCITARQPAVGNNPEWQTRAGDVYAYRV
jgi:FkbM family methyltransferase